jgi:hypothetical protein
MYIAQQTINLILYLKDPYKTSKTPKTNSLAWTQWSFVAGRPNTQWYLHVT